MEGPNLRESTAKLMGTRLKETEDRKPLQCFVYRLMGQFAYKAFKATKDDRVSLRNFPHL